MDSGLRQGQATVVRISGYSRESLANVERSAISALCEIADDKISSVETRNEDDLSPPVVYVTTVSRRTINTAAILSRLTCDPLYFSQLVVSVVRQVPDYSNSTVPDLFVFENIPRNAVNDNLQKFLRQIELDAHVHVQIVCRNRAKRLLMVKAVGVSLSEMRGKCANKTFAFEGSKGERVVSVDCAKCRKLAIFSADFEKLHAEPSQRSIVFASICEYLKSRSLYVSDLYLHADYTCIVACFSEINIAGILQHNVIAIPLIVPLGNNNADCIATPYFEKVGICVPGSLETVVKNSKVRANARSVHSIVVPVTVSSLPFTDPNFALSFYPCVEKLSYASWLRVTHVDASNIKVALTLAINTSQLDDGAPLSGVDDQKRLFSDRFCADVLQVYETVKQQTTFTTPSLRKLGATSVKTAAIDDITNRQFEWLHESGELERIRVEYEDCVKIEDAIVQGKRSLQLTGAPTEIRNCRAEIYHTLSQFGEHRLFAEPEIRALFENPALIMLLMDSRVRSAVVQSMVRNSDRFVLWSVSLHDQTVTLYGRFKGLQSHVASMYFCEAISNVLRHTTITVSRSDYALFATKRWSRVLASLSNEFDAVSAELGSSEEQYASLFVVIGQWTKERKRAIEEVQTCIATFLRDNKTLAEKMIEEEFRFVLALQSPDLLKPNFDAILYEVLATANDEVANVETRLELVNRVAINGSKSWCGFKVSGCLSDLVRFKQSVDKLSRVFDSSLQISNPISCRSMVYYVFREKLVREYESRNRKCVFVYSITSEDGVCASGILSELFKTLQSDAASGAESRCVPTELVYCTTVAYSAWQNLRAYVFMCRQSAEVQSWNCFNESDELCADLYVRVKMSHVEAAFVQMPDNSSFAHKLGLLTRDKNAQLIIPVNYPAVDVGGIVHEVTVYCRSRRLQVVTIIFENDYNSLISKVMDAFFTEMPENLATIKQLNVLSAVGATASHVISLLQQRGEKNLVQRAEQTRSVSQVNPSVPGQGQMGPLTVLTGKAASHASENSLANSVGLITNDYDSKFQIKITALGFDQAATNSCINDLRALIKRDVKNESFKIQHALATFASCLIERLESLYNASIDITFGQQPGILPDIIQCRISGMEENVAACREHLLDLSCKSLQSEAAMRLHETTRWLFEQPAHAVPFAAYDAFANWKIEEAHRTGLKIVTFERWCPHVHKLLKVKVDLRSKIEIEQTSERVKRQIKCIEFYVRP